MKKSIWTHVIMLACSFVLGLFLVPSLSLKAATAKVVDIPTGNEENCGLNNYDIDGDGIADILKVYDGYFEGEETAYYDYYGRVTLNGESAMIFGLDEEFSGYSAKLIILKNGKKFLFLSHTYSESSKASALYQFSNGKFEEILDLNAITGSDKYGTVSYISSIKVSDNTLIVYAGYDSYIFGESVVKYKYVYKSGKLKKSPSYGWVSNITQKKSGKTFKSNTLITKKSLKAYKSATSNKKYKTIKKGKKVKVSRIYSSTKYGMRIRCKYQGKNMWIKCSKSMKNGYFKYIYHEEY